MSQGSWVQIPHRVFAAIAQLVERVTCNHKVLSSILNEGLVLILWECSSNGRALALHARGKGFDTLLFQSTFGVVVTWLTSIQPPRVRFPEGASYIISLLFFAFFKPHFFPVSNRDPLDRFF